MQTQRSQRIWATVSSDYTNYVARGCDGYDNIKSAGKWGYDTEFLNTIFTDQEMESLHKVFDSACGGGSPLRISSEAFGKFCFKNASIVDLGCGAGHDVIIASRLAGPGGKIIGVDLTQAMLDKAQQSADLLVTSNPNCAPVVLKQARLDDGKDLEGIVPANSADFCISNGVFNLTANKENAFHAAFRVLKPGGFFLLADVMKKKS